MPLYNQLPIRLQADLVSNPPVVPTDANTGLPVQFWRAQGLAVELGVFDAQQVGVDLSNVAYVQLIIQEAQTSLSPLLVKQVDAGAIIPVVTRAGWLDGSNQNARFVLSKAETDFPLSGSTEATYWLQIVAVTTSGANIVYAAGAVRVFNPGLPPQPPTTLVSAHEQASGGGNLSVTPTTQVHHEEITVSGAAGTRDLVVGASGLVKGATCVLRFQLPATDGLSIRIFDQTLSGDLLTTLTCDPDGFIPAARVALWFDGANWQRDSLIIPAFGQQT